MNKREYEKVLEILEEYVETVWITPNYCKHYIPNEKLVIIRERLKELVK